MKLAHIRFATRDEVPKFFRPLVCAGPDGVYYLFDLNARVITDTSGKVVAKLPKGLRERRYDYADGTSLTVMDGLSSLSIDGHQLKEQWPTPRKRVFAVGNRTFMVKPEDDSVMFEFDGEKPPLDLTVAAFLVAPYARAGIG